MKAGHTIRRKVDLREIVIHGGVRHKYGYYAKCCRTKSSRQSRSPLKKRKTRERRSRKPKLPKNVNQIDATCMPRETPSCSDDGYAFWAETPVDMVSAPFVSLKVNGVKCNFLVDSGASENILSLSASKVCSVNLKSCDTRVYVYNSSDPFHVLGNFWPLVESKCSAVQSEFFVVNSHRICHCHRTRHTSHC